MLNTHVGRTILSCIGILILSLLFQGCDTTSNDTSETHYYEFTSKDDQSGNYSFVVKTSNPEVIDKVENQLSKPQSQRNLHINGQIERGNPGYNNEWSWHFTEEAWNLAEASIEVCDGTPQMVEENLDYWVEDVGRFCPWSSIVLQEVNPQ